MNKGLIRILDAAPVAMVVSHPDGSFEYVNPAMLQMLGYTEDEIYQKEVTISPPDEWASNQVIREQLKTSPFTPITIEKRYVHKSGRIIPGLLTIVALPDAKGDVERLIAQIVDLSQRKKEEESLWLLTLLLNNAHDAIYVADPLSGGILECNRLGHERLGYTHDEMLRMNVTDINKSLSVETSWQEMVEKTKAGDNIRESIHTHKDGSSFPVEASVSYVTKGDKGYMISVIRDITVRKKNEAIIWKQANFDPLTELPNRRLLQDRLKQEIKKAQRSKQRIAVLYLDLDRFKEVNDSLGHPKGDVLLVETAKRLKSCVRDSDTLARQGGDEFAIILGELGEKNHVERVVKDILTKLSEPFQLGDDRVYVSASIGICFYPDDGATPESLFKGADLAMYSAKDQGRNCFRYFTPSMHQAAITRIGLVRDLREALERNQFHLVYQPVVDLTTGEIHNAEALLRWQHPEQGILYPLEFITIAEETKLIADIGSWVFHQAVRQILNWRQNHDPDFKISINTSPIQYRDSKEEMKRWIPYLQEQGLPGQALAIEITEGVLMDSHTGITEQLIHFHAAGIDVVLDDFGTGYSSLAHLKKFDVDYIKIDRTFIKDLTVNPDDLVLCEAIVAMAHKLGIKVIAEGIETPEQREILKTAGCDYGQGYLFSKPVTATEFEQLLSQKEQT